MAEDHGLCADNDNLFNILCQHCYRWDGELWPSNNNRILQMTQTTVYNTTSFIHTPIIILSLYITGGALYSPAAKLVNSFFYMLLLFGKLFWKTFSFNRTCTCILLNSLFICSASGKKKVLQNWFFLSVLLIVVKKCLTPVSKYYCYNEILGTGLKKKKIIYSCFLRKVNNGKK